MAIDETKMVQSIYDTLFNAYTKTPPGGLPAGSQADKVFINLIPGGEPIDVAQYANPISPLNPQGIPAAAENFSRLVDRVPLVNGTFVDTGKKVSEVYKQVVEGASITPQPVDPALKAAYDAAFDLLNDKGQDFNDLGQPIEVDVDSLLYVNYKRKQNAYIDAVASFVAESSKYDMTKPADQRAWAMLGPSLQRRLITAWNDFQTAQAKRVEDALATMAQSATNQVGRVFKDAQEKLVLLEKGSARDQAEKYFASYAFPANWYSSSAAQGWSSLSFTSSRYQLNESSSFKKFGGGAKFSLGLWSVGGGASHSETRRHMDSQSDDLSVSFRYARINIDRPWMNPMIFDLPGWKYGVMGKGSIASGNPATADGRIMPLLPTGFIVVRDLKISATWSSAEKDYISKSTKGGGSFGWGPFSVGGSYESNSTNFRFQSEFDGRTLSAPGLQLMAFINTVLPMSPKE